MPKKIKPILPGAPVRGSPSGRPIMAAFDLLGRRMSMRIIWELRDQRLTFRALQDAVGTNPSVLNTRLAELRQAMLIDHKDGGYGVTDQGQRLILVMLPMIRWSEEWAVSLVDVSASIDTGV